MKPFESAACSLDDDDDASEDEDDGRQAGGQGPGTVRPGTLSTVGAIPVNGAKGGPRGEGARAAETESWRRILPPRSQAVFAWIQRAGG